MKTAATLLQIIALLACFTAYQAFSEERTGVRRTVAVSVGPDESVRKILDLTEE